MQKYFSENIFAPDLERGLLDYDPRTKNYILKLTSLIFGAGFRSATSLQLQHTNKEYLGLLLTLQIFVTVKNRNHINPIPSLRKF